MFAACARFDKAVEINCRPERQDPPEELLPLALEWGCKVSIDTDAHAPGQLEWQPYGCDKAARLGVEPDDIDDRQPRLAGRPPRRLRLPSASHRGISGSGRPVASMSKKTTKRKIKARRNKANHGRKPNAGRG